MKRVGFEFPFIVFEDLYFRKNHPGNIVEVETESRETSNSLLEKR